MCIVCSNLLADPLSLIRALGWIDGTRAIWLISFSLVESGAARSLLLFVLFCGDINLTSTNSFVVGITDCASSGASALSSAAVGDDKLDVALATARNKSVFVCVCVCVRVCV